MKRPKLDNLALMVLVPLFFYFVYSLINLEYAYNMGLKTDDVCLICDFLDQYESIRWVLRG